MPFVGFLEELLSTPVDLGLGVVLFGGLLLAMQVRELVTPRGTAPAVPSKSSPARAYVGVGVLGGSA
ncbi:MAG: hypothetical protein Q9O62_09990 [Ardenticatenia bacterium]|nr:hypothetical protein [Ardenticatenia bacterium]